MIHLIDIARDLGDHETADSLTSIFVALDTASSTTSHQLEIVDGVARELYNLAADPYETNNQIDREPGVARELSSRIADVRDLADSVESDNREVIEQLKQIGYIQ